MRRGSRRQYTVRIVRVVLALASIVALLPASGAAQGDDTATRELTRYLLVAASGGGGEPRSVDVLPARLPGDLPLALPAPPSGRLVGSSVLYTRMRTLAWDVIYDAPGVVSDINDFYANALPRLGWNPPRSEDRPARGFYPAVMGVAQRGIFCGSGASLLVNTAPTAANTLLVRVRVEANGSLCASSATTQTSGPSAADALPGLAAPPGVPLRLTSGGFTADRAATTATAATTLPAAELQAHYARQLEAAGWTRTEGANTGPLVWSTWAVPGAGDFRGFLSVLEVSDDRRELTVQLVAPSVRGPNTPASMPPSAPPTP